MSNAMKVLSLPESSSAQIVAVRNENDAFLHPELINDIAEKRGWKVERLDGQHDDLWKNPEPYIDILMSILDLDEECVSY